ncbi:MAG: hypothetical protein PHP31_05125 [Lentimicrobiaceae bacterium]|nr:hypothetical protein [Lentimicrobiaceae bacterium]
MRKLALLLLLAIAFVSCESGKTEKQFEDWKNFFGRWEKSDYDEGTFFILDFRSKADTLSEISYSSMGPFEEILVGKLTSETSTELFFDYIMGSMSFNNATEQDEAALDECRKNKVADCTINPDGTMTVQTYSDKCGQLPPNTKIILSKIAEPELSGNENDNDIENDPFREVIAEYSPEQIKQLIEKSEPQDVRDLFVLLPDDLCYEYSATDRKKVAQGERVGEYGGIAIGELDVKNGYFDLSGAWEGIWEMFAKKQDNTWWIAVNQQYCGPMCYTHIANTYTFENGKLIQHSYANLAGYQDVWLELFIDMDKLTEAQKKQANDIWEENGFESVLFSLPRDGKTITMYIENEPYIEIGIPENAFKEIKKNIFE